MRRSYTVSSAWSLAAACLVLAGTACSDSVTGPRSLAAGDDASLSVGTGVPAPGATQIALASGAGTSFLGSNPNATVAPTFGLAPFTGAAAVSLVSPQNVAWHTPLTGSAWIGPQTNAGASSVLPGTYRYATTFNIPAGATNLLLNVSVYNDNATRVYLNGTEISGGAQAIADCPTGNNSACNWQTLLNLTATPIIGNNTLTIDVVNTRVGYNGDPASPTATNPCLTPTDAGPGWTAALCQNPTGLDFAGIVYYTPFVPPVADRGCSPGYWKNHDNWPAPYTKNTLFSAVFENAFGTQTLQQVLSSGGGGLTALGRATVSALLNAQSFGAAHYGESAAQVIADFNAVFPGGDYDGLKAKFEAMQDVNGRTCF